MQNGANGHRAVRTISELLRWLPPSMVAAMHRRWRAVNEAMASDWSRVFYEVEDYEIELVIRDAAGQHATCTRRERIRPLDSRVLAYQDVVWGDGDVLRGYDSNLGQPVDVLVRNGRQHLLMWLPEPLQPRQSAILETRQELRGCFIDRANWHEIAVRHFTHHVSARFVFPQRRPPETLQATYFSPISNNRHAVKCRLSTLEGGRTAASWDYWYPIAGSTLRTEWTW